MRHEVEIVCLDEIILREGVHVVIEIIIGVRAFLAQIHKGLHRRAGTGNRLFHGLHGIVPTERHDHVDFLSAAGRAIAVIKLRRGQPSNGEFIVLHDHLARRPPVARFSDSAELVQGGVKLKAAPHETGGAAARHVVLFDQQRFLSRSGKRQRRGQAACPGADDHRIVLVQIYSLRSLCFYKLLFHVSACSANHWHHASMPSPVFAETGNNFRRGFLMCANCSTFSMSKSK